MVYIILVINLTYEYRIHGLQMDRTFYNDKMGFLFFFKFPPNNTTEQNEPHCMYISQPKAKEFTSEYPFMCNNCSPK